MTESGKRLKTMRTDRSTRGVAYVDTHNAETQSRNRMEILYLKEHTSCSYYSKDNQDGFSYHKFCDMGTGMDIDTSKADCILFVMKGSVDLSCDECRKRLSAGGMICLHRKCLCKVHPQWDGSIVIMRFGKEIHSCGKFSLSQLCDGPSRLNLPHP